MRKHAVLCLALACILALSGCGAARTVSGLIESRLPPGAAETVYRVIPALRPEEEPPPENAIVVYRVAEGGVSGGELIRAEACDPPAEGVSALQAALEAFASPARKEGLSCALPEDVRAESVSQEGAVVRLALSPEYLALSDMERTVTAFCAALTFCGIEGVSAVTITAGGQTVFSGLMPEDALLTDAPNDPYVRQLRLFFSDDAGRYLVSEYHSLTLDENTSPERYVVEELLRGPNGPELRSAIPEGTRLLSCATEDGVCTVDLSAEFYDRRPATAVGERLAVYSIVDSLTALYGVDSVRILVEGEPVDTYVCRSLAQPLAYYDEAVGPVSEAKGEFDADLYLPLPGLEGIASLPFRVSGTAYASRAEAVLGALLGCAEPGYPSILPGSGSIAVVTVQGTMCTVDLSESFFVSLPENARGAAVQSIAATISDLPGIAAVRFTIGGEAAVFDEKDWSGPWSNMEEFEVN